VGGCKYYRTVPRSILEAIRGGTRADAPRRDFCRQRLLENRRNGRRSHVTRDFGSIDGLDDGPHHDA